MAKNLPCGRSSRYKAVEVLERPKFGVARAQQREEVGRAAGDQLGKWGEADVDGSLKHSKAFISQTEGDHLYTGAFSGEERWDPTLPQTVHPGWLSRPGRGRTGAWKCGSGGRKTSRTLWPCGHGAGKKGVEVAAGGRMSLHHQRTQTKARLLANTSTASKEQNLKTARDCF